LFIQTYLYTALHSYTVLHFVPLDYTYLYSFTICPFALHIFIQITHILFVWIMHVYLYTMFEHLLCFCALVQQYINTSMYIWSSQYICVCLPVTKFIHFVCIYEYTPTLHFIHFITIYIYPLSSVFFHTFIFIICLSLSCINFLAFTFVDFLMCILLSCLRSLCGF
jgi:hypothetical protein